MARELLLNDRANGARAPTRVIRRPVARDAIDIGRMTCRVGDGMTRGTCGPAGREPGRPGGRLISIYRARGRSGRSPPPDGQGGLGWILGKRAEADGSLGHPPATSEGGWASCS